MPFLPLISDKEQYQVFFHTQSSGLEAATYLAEVHKLKGPISRSSSGSHIVYRVGENWIKMMAPLFGQDMVYEVEGLRAAQGKLSVSLPQLIVQGKLEGWPYIILSHVAGESLKSLWPTFSIEQKVRTTKDMAQVTKEITQCQALPESKKRFLWDEFIQSQYLGIEDRQKAKGLSLPWIQNVNTFIKRFSLDEFLCEQPQFVHGDLTAEHFLLDPKSGQVLSLIDFADSQVAHFEYELVAPTIFILKKNRKLLRTYLNGCGFLDTQLNARFSEKLLAWALLHRYCGFNEVIKAEMEQVEAGDFMALAQVVFPL